MILIRTLVMILVSSIVLHVHPCSWYHPACVVAPFLFMVPIHASRYIVHMLMVPHAHGPVQMSYWPHPIHVHDNVHVGCCPHPRAHGPANIHPGHRTIACPIAATVACNLWPVVHTSRPNHQSVLCLSHSIHHVVRWCKSYRPWYNYPSCTWHVSVCNYKYRS